MSLPKFAPSLIPLGSRTWTSVCLHWSVHFPELKLYLHLGDCDTHPQAQDLRCLKSQLFSPTCSRNPMVPLAQAGGCQAPPRTRLDRCEEPYSGLSASELNPRQKAALRGPRRTPSPGGPRRTFSGPQRWLASLPGGSHRVRASRGVRLGD